MATLQFLGAIQQVTGSCYLIESESVRVLLECGMIQGERNSNQKKDRDQDRVFDFDAKSIDAVIISHAHLDHSGLLPRLVREGFGGEIYVTTPTADLLDIMLKDAAFLQQKDNEWENRRRARSGKDPIEPLYEIEDVEQVLEQLVPISYGERAEVVTGIELRYRDAGHIIGSAIVEVWINESGATRKLVFSGDLGNNCSPLLRDPEVVDEADVLMLESTYGDRNHRPQDETLDEFAEILDVAMQKGGNVYIPSFAVGRTQDLLYRLGKFHREGKLKQQKIFLDSPMATSVSKVYVKHSRLYNQDDPEFNKSIKSGWVSWLPMLTFTQSTEESMALNNISGGAIIIAGSGMCTGGRIRHHLKHNLWHRNNQLVFVGFQARGTLGRILVDGAKRVNIMGEKIAVNAQVHTLGGFSAHAGQQQLLNWADHFKSRPKLYLVHGEIEKMLVLQKQFMDVHNWYANIPSPRERITL
ncbi:MAG: MBL fold metallo-hydrolase [Gammaproteobacteria bacterium]